MDKSLAVNESDFDTYVLNLPTYQKRWDEVKKQLDALQCLVRPIKYTVYSHVKFYTESLYLLFNSYIYCTLYTWH